MKNDEKRFLYDSVIAEYNSGRTPVEIAQHLSVSTSTVRAVIKYMAQASAGIPFTEKQRRFNCALALWAEARRKIIKVSTDEEQVPDKHPKLGDIDDDTAFQRYDLIYQAVCSGVKHENIAKQFNVGVRTIRRIISIRKAAESGIDFPANPNNRRISRWAKLRTGSPEPSPDANTESYSSKPGALPKVNAHDKFAPERHLCSSAKDALFSRLHFICELIDQAYRVEDSELIWRLRFCLDAFQNEVAAFEKAMGSHEKEADS